MKQIWKVAATRSARGQEEEFVYTGDNVPVTEMFFPTRGAAHEFYATGKRAFPMWRWSLCLEFMVDEASTWQEELDNLRWVYADERKEQA